MKSGGGECEGGEEGRRVRQGSGEPFVCGLQTHIAA